MKIPQYKAKLTMLIVFSSIILIIYATVNPENNHSGQNFIKRGFAVKKTVTKYGGLTRNLLEFKVNS